VRWSQWRSLAAHAKRQWRSSLCPRSQGKLPVKSDIRLARISIIRHTPEIKSVYLGNSRSCQAYAEETLCLYLYRLRVVIDKSRGLKRLLGLRTCTGRHRNTERDEIGVQGLSILDSDIGMKRPGINLTMLSDSLCTKTSRWAELVLWREFERLLSRE